MSREMVIINPKNMVWEPVEEMGPGAWLKVLSYDEETKAGAYLIKFDNGFKEPLHSHPGAHDILFLQGCLVDDDGNETCAGSYFFSPAGQENEHGPYTAKGDVIFFAYFDGPVFYPGE